MSDAAYSVAAAPLVNIPAFQWLLDPSPNVGTGSNILQAVKAVSPFDVWAAGTSDVTDAGGRTLIQHWNGRAWSVVPSPSRPSGPNYFGGIGASSRRNVWAVGGYYDGSNQYTLIERWNGTNWEITPSPNGSTTGGNALIGVAPLAPNDVWAVGMYNNGPFFDKTLTMHWDGSTWQTVNSPNASQFDGLFGVAARTGSDAWAVGLSAPDGSLANSRPLAMRWDGKAWTLEPVPLPVGASDGFLYSIAYRSRNDVWAVGTYKAADGLWRGLAVRWNGTQWSVLPTYNVQGTVFSEWRSLAVTRSGDVWVGGWSATTAPPTVFIPPRAYPGTKTLLLRWTGTGWEGASSPTPGVGSELMGMAACGNRVWAVGNYITEAGNPTRTLITHLGRSTDSDAADHRLGCAR